MKLCPDGAQMMNPNGSSVHLTFPPEPVQCSHLWFLGKSIVRIDINFGVDIFVIAQDEF